MRLIKSNNINYPAFQNSLPVVKKYGKGNIDNETFPGFRTEAGSDYLGRVLNFQNEINNSKTESETGNVFRNEILQCQGHREATIYLYDSNNKIFSTLGEDNNYGLTNIINKVYKKGLLNWIFETGQSTIIPEYGQSETNATKLNYVVIPIIRENKKYGLVTLLTRASALPELLTESKYIKICLNIVLSKIDKLELKRDLSSTFQNLHAYQSKLTNDFKLSAIGELTSGIVEEILSPLQVILSYTDMLMQTSNEDSIDSFEKIKSQVKRVETMVSRLIKFASLDDKQVKIRPCDINEIIGEFYSVINSSLERENYECLLDLEQDLPSVLSHPNYIMQLLTHIFSMIKPQNKNGGGIYIHSKYVKGNVNVKVITTDYFNELSDSNNKGVHGTTYKILQNIMEKHNGYITMNSSEIAGTSIMAVFSLK